MRVKIKNPKWNIKSRFFFDVPEFFWYDGEEITLKWVDSSVNLCLTTGISDFPARIIPRRLIAESDGATTHQPSLDRTVVVRGSKGSDYVVSLGKSKSCTCSGFQFRGKCKHLAEAEKVVQ